ncbi:MAG: hypothetical protein AAB967_00640 [Patescibacteria group bacterium]
MIVSSPFSDHWAWNDVIGWLNFLDGTPAVDVSNAQLTGIVLTGTVVSSVGEISLSGSTYGVSNDGNGGLSGWAWNDAVGWVSFWCGNSGGGDCGTSPYRVTIDPQSGVFWGDAWNDVVGWVSVNCANHSSCQSSDPNFYRVVTDWWALPSSGTLTSKTFDTGVPGGARINSILWNGNLNGGTVEFQLAVSNDSTGPWDGTANFFGPDGTSGTYFSSDEIASSGRYVAPIDFKLPANAQYFRYKVKLAAPPGGQSPRVDEIIVNWSP